MESLLEKLAKKTLFDQGPFHCNVWVGALHQGKYGKMLVDWPDGTKCMERTHRIAFMAANKVMKGNLPSHDAGGSKLEVSHLCHNGVCVKPSHLVLETHEKNMERLTCQKQGHCCKLHNPHCIM